jgi:hypothetical protein
MLPHPTLMNQTDLNELLEEGRFSPFVITTFDGFSLAIGEQERKHMLVAARMLITLDAEGNAIHIPYRSIAHIQQP